MESLFEENEVEKEVDLNKRFQFPQHIVIKKFEDKNLVIYTEGVLWLVFTDDELEVYYALSTGMSIQETLEEFDEDIVVSVLSQIEAKRFETPIINESHEKNIYIYLTNNCNEHCRHCYMYAGDIKIQEMLPQAWKKVLYDFKTNGGTGVTFTGGEVTIYKNFESLLKYAKELGLIVTVLTNGIAWKDQTINRCAPYIDEIQISIDGYDKESYYSVRQYDGFDKALSTLQRFCKLNVRTSMAVTPLYDDLDEFVLKFESFAKSIIENNPNIFIRFNLELLDGRDIQTTLIDNKTYRRKIKDLVERLYPNYYIETFPLNYEGHVIRKNCGFGDISIAANGDVYWCNRIHELSSNWNITTSKFTEIMKASERIKVSTDIEHSSPCHTCEVKFICGGTCRMNYDGIKYADKHEGNWNIKCPIGTKEEIFKKMILCNEFFYLDNDGE